MSGQFRGLLSFSAALTASVTILLLLHGRPILPLLKRPAAVLALLGLCSYSLCVFPVEIGGKAERCWPEWWPMTLLPRVMSDYGSATVLIGEAVERPFMALSGRIYLLLRSQAGFTQP